MFNRDGEGNLRFNPLSAIGRKLELPIFFVHLDRLAFAEFSFQDIEAERIEQIALNDPL